MRHNLNRMIDERISLYAPAKVMKNPIAIGSQQKGICGGIWLEHPMLLSLQSWHSR